MPEQISKYPDVTLEVLKGAGAKCAEGAPQRILKQCPAEQFCALRTGEICVYGIDEIPKMTQIEAEELARVVCPASREPAIDAVALTGTEGPLLAALFAGGVLLGRIWRRRSTGG